MGKVFQKITGSKITLIFLPVIFFIIYSFKLNLVPVHLNQDELEFSLNAYSISKTLVDRNGIYLPFYFWHLDNFWATPIVTYFAALFLKFLPLSEGNIRIPSVVIGIASVVLVMIITHLIFKKRYLVIFSGFLFATSPALFINSRLLLDNIYPIFFTLLWILFLKLFLDKKNIFLAFLSGLALGIGFHSYHAAKILMPLYFIFTAIFFFKKFRKKILAFGLAFLIPVLIFIPWLKIHPDTLINQIGYISSIDKTISTNKGLYSFLTVEKAKSFIISYFSYFDPKILFISGDKTLIHSTEKFGVFLFPIAILILIGVIYAIYEKENKFSRLFIFGLLVYPVPPSLINDPERTSRSLGVIVFATFLSMYATKYLSDSKDMILRTILIFIYVFIPLLFIIFLKDYYFDYPKRSYQVFNNNIGGAIESVLRSTKIREVSTIYLDKNIYFVTRYFDFYKIKNGEISIPQKVRVFDPNKESFVNFPEKSIVLVRSNYFSDRSDKYGEFEKIEVIKEPDGKETFHIFYRD